MKVELSPQTVVSCLTLILCLGKVDLEVANAQKLAGWASLSAFTFSPGPTSGQFIDFSQVTVPAEAPFVERQPIQGFSGMILTQGGDLLAISDNGFGGQHNSYDFLLRITRLGPRFQGTDGGPGAVSWKSEAFLWDPDLHIPFPIVASMENYPASNDSIPVDPFIRSGRYLTGGDFDIESFRRGPDGTYWFGDEFGPFLLHTDSTGRLLDPPIPLPGIFSPENPLRGEIPANARSSGGFEGMALTIDGSALLPVLERPLVGEDPLQVNIYKFDLLTKRWATEEPVRRYRLESPEHCVADFTTISPSRFLAIERDELQGRAARFKKIYLVDIDRKDDEGYIRKRELVDLLRIPNPDAVTSSNYFTFPFITIESVVVLDERTICVANDNNFPFSVGRHEGTGYPDDNELILIRFDEPIAEMRMNP